MGIFHIFWIEQMVPNRVKQQVWLSLFCSKFFKQLLLKILLFNPFLPIGNERVNWPSKYYNDYPDDTYEILPIIMLTDKFQFLKRKSHALSIDV